MKSHKFLENKTIHRNQHTLISVTLANIKFVKASATVSLAPFFSSTNILIGCSPIDVAAPTVSKCDKAVTATSAKGV